MFTETLDGFLKFCDVVGLDLEPFQVRIATAFFEGERELLVLLPKGNGKTTLLAAVAVHHLVTHPAPRIYCGAATVAQANVLLEAAKRIAGALPAEVRPRVLKLELRREDATNGVLRMLPSDGPKTHGITPTLGIVDELWAHKDAALYESMRSAMVKNAAMRLVTISTADVGDERPLCKLRTRALAHDVSEAGPPVECHGPGLQALLWEVPDGTTADDLDAIAAVNPASWITPELLAEQRESLPEASYMRYHANARLSEGSWLPAGAWSAAVGSPTFEDGEPIWIGCDVGGTEAATAVVWMNAAGHVGAWIETAEDAILNAVQMVRELAGTYRIEEFCYDPWRCRQAALELEQEGVRCVEFQQTDVRMCPASVALRSAITEGRLTLPDDPDLRRHAGNCVAKHSRRGWRIDSPGRGVQIDSIIAMAMANSRREFQPEPVRVLAWI